jgi:hypothetical protein
VHSSSNGFDFSRNPAFGFVGQAFVAQFGDQAPVTGKTLAPVGFKVVRVDVSSGIIKDFAVNKGGVNGPASRIGDGGLERPVAARFDPSGAALYVVDFGGNDHGSGLGATNRDGGGYPIGAKLSSCCLLASSMRPCPVVAVVYYVSEEAGG